MPSRGSLRPATWLEFASEYKGYFNPVYQYTSGYNAIGLKQTISALNNAGVWTPGILRLNPVTIEKRQGVSIPTRYVMKTGEYWPASDGVYKYYKTISGDIAAVLGSSQFSYIDTLAAWDSSMASYSIQKSYSKLSEPEFDVGVILAELSETIHGIRHPLDALRKYIRDFNKISKSSPTRLSRTLNMLSGSWLEWRYGITPLIITIESAIEHFKEQSRTLENKLLRKRGKVKKESNYTRNLNNRANWFLFENPQALINVKKTVVTSSYYKMTSPLTWEEIYGLNALNLPAIVWEKVPLSFVLDWFLGVGTWLQSINLSDKRTIIGSSTSQKTVITMDVPDVVAYYFTNRKYNTGSSYQFKLERLERRVNQAPPLLPVVNPASLSLQREIDALSLIWQRLPKFRR